MEYFNIRKVYRPEELSLLIEKIKKSAKKKERTSYLLSEIAIEKVQGISMDEKYKEILTSIDSIGFKNTANLYSSTDSAKFGGNIGWILKPNFKNKLIEKINKIDIGEITTPIQVGNFFLILKLENIKKEKLKLNFDGKIYNYSNLDSTKSIFCNLLQQN